MKIFNKYCEELEENGGILKDKYYTLYYKPGYVSHRVDGPASEWYNGEKEWWYNGERIMSTKGDITPEQVQEFLLRIL